MLTALACLLAASLCTYSPPVSYDMTLAGNFGEPRPNHFHCGIDVKTGGVEGKPIYAIADGYVSRITVGLNGFGNAVYITHPDGRTSVYCHLREFSPRIKAFLRRWQYEHESFHADVRLAPTDVPVARGQLVAVSGNSGSSLAPHLHLELHDSFTGQVTDPLTVLSSHVADSVPPTANGFMVIPIAGEGTFEGSSKSRTFHLGTNRSKRSFTAWGKVGFAIWATDHMQASHNWLGVYQTVLRIDGHETFRCTIDSIPPDMMRQMNIWGDYRHWRHNGVWYLKSFVPNGCTLPFLHTNSTGGYVTFNEERDYEVEYELTDRFGNTSTYAFTVCARPTPIPPRETMQGNDVMRHDQQSTYSAADIRLTLPAGTLTEDIRLKPRTTTKRGATWPEYTFADEPTPLLGWAELSIYAGDSVANASKLYIENSTGRYYGGTTENGWVTTRVRDLDATYTIASDDEPPTVTPLDSHKWAAQHTVRLKATDKGSGIKAFRGTIDGNFVLFEKEDRKPRYFCRLDETPLKPTGRTRHLRFEVTDNRDNCTVFETEIVY